MKSTMLALINKAKNHAIQVKNNIRTANFIDVQLYEMLREVFYLIEENKQSELGLGDGGSFMSNPYYTNQMGLGQQQSGDQTQKIFIEVMFHTILCQNSYMQFKKTKLFSKPIKEILREANLNLNRSDVGETIDTNFVKKLGSRSKFASKKNSSTDNFNQNAFKSMEISSHQNGLNNNLQNLFGDKQDEKKTLYDVCFDIIVYIFLQMHENDEGEVNYEVCQTIITAFVKHIRMHQSQNVANQMHCLQAYLAMNKLFQNSKNFLTLAKEKDVINVIFSILPYMFKEEAQQMNQQFIGNQGPEFNLNQLVIGQGFQGAQGYQSQIQPSQSPMILNSKNEEDSRRGPQQNDYLDKPYTQKLSFNRASSEPPSANKNAVVPVKEDIHDEDIDYDQKGSQDVDTNRNPPRIPGIGERAVPPLMMSQVQSMQNQLELQHQISSNSVMNNYFNMPLFNTTMNQGSNNIGFKMNFIPQNTLAKSRITRRQMSMSRKHTQKLGSVSNFAQLMYGEESSKNRDNTVINHLSHDLQIGDQTQKSTSQMRKGPAVPKLNINSIVNDSSNTIQRMDPMGLYTTTHAAQMTQLNKSSNRSNHVSAYSNNNFENQLAAAQQKMGSNLHLNYQTNTNVIRQQINESEDHNISIYDEINGSFVDDLGDGQNGYIYDNAEEKLRQLAMQLGESCLTNDLAALISQKRDIELVKSARKTATNPRFQGINKSRTMSLKPLVRSISVSYTAENIFKHKNSIKDLGDIMNQVTNLQNQRLIDLKNQRIQETKAINQRARVVALNLAYQLLKKYDIEEARFLKHPIQALNSFIGSDNFHDKKHLKQILELENQSLLIDSNIDQEISQNGKIVINCNDPTQLQQITEANQSDTEEIKESDNLGTHEQNDDSRYSHNIYGTQATFHKYLSFYKISPQEKLDQIMKEGQVFNQFIYQEEKVIFKIYKKFTFINEDILRKQVMNELATFAAKEKGLDQRLYNTLTSAKLNQNSSFANGLFMVNNLMNHGSSMNPPISGTPIKNLNNANNLSFDDADEDFYFKRERNPDSISTLSDPNNLWLHNGISYEVNTPSSSKSTAASTVSKERIRKKLDVLLYTVDRRLKYIIQQYPDKTQTRFADELKREITTLNTYIEHQSSRIMLYQIIEVCLESILMIKKCMIDIALKTSTFVIDFSKHLSSPELISQSNYRIKTPNVQSSAGLERQNYLIENQKAHRTVFSEFLKLVSNLLLMSQTPESLKLLNEVLIFDEQWSECVKTFSISLFLSDIVSTISFTDKMNTQNVSLIIEELRGINLISFDEPSFISQIMTTQNLDLYQMCKESIYHMLLCSLNIMRYFKSVLHFFNGVIKIYFNNFGQQQKNKYPASGGPDGDGNKGELKQIQLDKKPEYSSAQKGGNEQNNNSNDAQQQKYWKHIIRKVLYQYMYLITPPNGLLSQYLQNNSINYVNLSNQANINHVRMSSPSRRTELAQTQVSYRTGNPPLNFKLTKSVLSFTKLMFNIPDKFTKYVFIEELMLFYIRTHYISFVRLYNKNYTKKDQILTQTKDISLNLCKKHLECLFCIAKNRNEDTRRKLYQFKVVQFLTQEIEMEFDFQQRRKRFIELSKEEKKKIDEQKQEQEVQIQIASQQVQQIDTIPKLGFGQGLKLNLGGVAGASLFSGQDPNKEKIDDVSQKNTDNTQSQQQDKQNSEPPSQIKKLPFAMKKLNISGLGLSELSTGGQNQLSQIEQDQLKLLQDNKLQNQQQQQQNLQQVQEHEESKQIQQNQPPKKLPFGLPKLNISGLGLSELTSGNNNQPSQIEQDQLRLLEEQKVQNQQQQVQHPQNPLPKKMPFAMPKLNVAGLGLSELAKDNSNNNQVSQIEQDQLRLLEEQKILALQKQQQQSIEQVNPQPKKMPFPMPKLNVAGLGLSELAKDNNSNNQVSQIEQDQLRLVEEQKIQALQQQQQQQNSQQVNPQPKKFPFAMPKLNIAGLGLSELAKDNSNNNQVSQIEQDQMRLLQEQRAQALKQNQLQKQEEDKKQEPQERDKPALNINVQGKLELAQPEESKSQNNQIVQQQQEQRQPQPPKKLGFMMPKLNISGLTLSELTPNHEVLHQQAVQQKVQQQQEEQKTIDPKVNDHHNNNTIDYGAHPKEQIFQKQPMNFDKTAPLKLFDVDEEQKGKSNQRPIRLAGQRLSDPQIVMESQESAQFLQSIAKNSHGMIVNIPEGELDEKRKQLLMKNRVNLLNRKRSVGQSNRSQSDNQQDLFMKQGKDQNKIDSSQYSMNVNGLKIESIKDMQSPNNVDARKYQNIQTEQKPENKMETLQVQDPLALSQAQLGRQPLSQNQTPVNHSSRSSTGSYVGRNKVFVPFLMFPDDIHIDPSEKIKIYQKPDDNRFRLMKTKENATPEIQRPGLNSIPGIEQSIPSQPSQTLSGQKPKGIGKRGKLLNINSNNSNYEGSLNSSGGNTNLDQNVQKFNFNFGKEEEEVKNNIPVNIPRPERKDDSKKDQEPLIKINADNVQPVISNLKKPMIPGLKIPEKQEKAEGQDKIKEQLQLQEELNKNQKENGILTQYEFLLNQQKNPKFQLLLDKTQLETHKDQPETFNHPTFALQQEPVIPQAIQREQQMTEANFYQKERNARPIYQDEELHVLMISLLSCLLLKPERGILDDLYCSQYPVDNGKQNILYLMHHHLNHASNQSVVQKVLNKVGEVHPPLAGQRLMKLLCSQLFDISMYNNGKNWTKIAEGAYAKVYEAETNLSDPQTVAVKQMLLPGTIYDRCVLHDIFTEITCLEELRLEPCVTDLYDYGVDHQCYYIVQKRYACSLREWRLQQNKSLSENLSVYLSIFKEFLRSMQIIQSHNVTHYDIKCDNVLIDVSSTSNNLTKVQTVSQDNDRLKLAIADFGECKIFSDEKDELCQRNRGTDYYKSPEMLQLTLNTRKDTDKYDRRKQVGTNRLSDIWSAGCMFYELLTGQILFYNADYFAFLNRVTRPSEALFTQDKLENINNNVYLIDFLKYMLVRDPRMRPSIDNVVKRFEHVHALLVSTSVQASGNNRFSLIGIQPSNRMGGGRAQNTLDHLLDQAQLIMNQNSLVYGGEIKEENLPQNQMQATGGLQDQENYNNINMSLGDDSIVAKTQKMMKGQQSNGSVMQILEDVFLTSERWLKENQLRSIQMGITHIIIEQQYSSQSLRDKFDVLEVQEKNEDHFLLGHSNYNDMNPFMMMTNQGVMDFLRKVALQRGKVAFVENSVNNGETMTRNGISQRLIRECLLICLNQIFQTNTYETYTLIKSQNLFFRISSQRLETHSKWSQVTTKINQYMQTFPRFQCLCGQCVIILKRQYANYQSMQTTNCNCCQYYKNVDSSQCPSPGCNEFIKFLKTFFKPIYQSQPIDALNWGYLEEDDFILGPNYLGQQQHNTLQKRMIMANMSKTIDRNAVLVSITEKKSQAQSNMRGTGMKDPMDFNMISKSSATVKNYNGNGYSRWKLYKCKECHVWTHAVNELENRYAVLLNNRVKDTQSSINILAVNSNQAKPAQVNIASLNAKQQQNTIGNNGQAQVRVPILQKIKLSLPF
eukprot:403357349